MVEEQLSRVRKSCLNLASVTERVSHGEPTFFVKKKVFVMFANHHHDGRIAVWLPVPEGFQQTLIESNPRVYFRPPYVGVRGWVGIELSQIGDEELRYHIETAWEIIDQKKKKL